MNKLCHYALCCPLPTSLPLIHYHPNIACLPYTYLSLSSISSHHWATYVATTRPDTQPPLGYTYMATTGPDTQPPLGYIHGHHWARYTATIGLHTWPPLGQITATIGLYTWLPLGQIHSHHWATYMYMATTGPDTQPPLGYIHWANTQPPLGYIHDTGPDILPPMGRSDIQPPVGATPVAITRPDTVTRSYLCQHHQLHVAPSYITVITLKCSAGHDII